MARVNAEAGGCTGTGWPVQAGGRTKRVTWRLRAWPSRFFGFVAASASAGDEEGGTQRGRRRRTWARSGAPPSQRVERPGARVTAAVAVAVPVPGRLLAQSSVGAHGRDGFVASRVGDRQS